MKIHRSVAEMILAYYRVKDSDHEAVDYHQRLDTMTRVCLHEFEYKKGMNSTDPHPLAELFLVLQSQEKSILQLDSIGADEIADQLQDCVLFTDMTLRAAVSKVTGTNVNLDGEVDYPFVDQFNNDTPNALWFEFHNRKK